MNQTMKTHRTDMSRVSKGAGTGGFRDMQLNTPERNKMVVIRKIIMYAPQYSGFPP